MTGVAGYVDHQKDAALPENLIRVPLVQQTQDFSCGAAATLLLLRYWCINGYAHADEAALYEALHTTRTRGTEPGPIADVLRQSGLYAEYRSGDVSVGDLERAVSAGEPPIVDLQAWSDHSGLWRETWDAGHYVVMVGFDGERLYFADPSRATPGGYAYLDRTELDERWHDLTGVNDEPVHSMAIFVRGTTRWLASGPLSTRATKLG